MIDRAARTFFRCFGGRTLIPPGGKSDARGRIRRRRGREGGMRLRAKTWLIGREAARRRPPGPDLKFDDAMVFEFWEAQSAADDR